MTVDEKHISRCLELAARGLGYVQPNPMVGAVIVHQQQIIGEGFHPKIGEPHAEVFAIESVEKKERLKDAVLYINLEPCNHKGKTPPCTHLIHRMGITRVVIAQNDPNPIVAGQGVQFLTQKGIEVTTGILESEARHLNRRFNTFHHQKRPYIILKWAQTTDGFVDKIRDPQKESPSWITDETCRRLVHKWRTEEAGILAGYRTILMDNPQLNVREWTGRNPVRITIDTKTELGNHQNLHLYDQSQPTLMFTPKNRKNQTNLDYILMETSGEYWTDILLELHNREIQSVIIEGGPTILNHLILNQLWDEARVFTGPVWFGKGIKGPVFPYSPQETKTIGNSQLDIFYHQHSE